MIHVEYAPRALFRLEKEGTDGRTDRCQTVRSSVYPLCPSIHLSLPFSTLIGRAAHTQRDSTGAARDAASVHFSATIRRTDIVVD